LGIVTESRRVVVIACGIWYLTPVQQHIKISFVDGRN